MANWLPAALDYIPRWVAHQARLHEIPGVAIAIARDGAPVLDLAFGVADVDTGEALTPEHRFRVASHSKTFTAVGVMKLVEAGRLRLDDRVGQHVDGLDETVGRATLAQLLCHSAGIIRDGTDAGQWSDRRPFLDEAELRAALASPTILPPNTRMKYTNHGFGLLGLVIAAVTGEAYVDWIAREVVAPAGLAHTCPDAPLPAATRFSRGHGSSLLLGRRPVIPGDNPTRALASATGFVSTAADLTRFFAQLDPAARQSLLSVESRREMTRRHWRVPDMPIELHYGLGTIQGAIGPWSWFGHNGGFQGFMSQTAVFAEPGITVSVITNAIDGAPPMFVAGVVRILQAFAQNGPPTRATAPWTGRWWGTVWPPIDLTPMGDKVMVALAGQWDPFGGASELEVTDGDTAMIRKASGFAEHGETARLVRGRAGRVSEVWIAGSRFQTETAARKAVKALYPRGR